MERRQAEEIYRRDFLQKQNGVNGSDKAVDDKESLLQMEVILISYLSSCLPHERFRHSAFATVLESSSSLPNFQPESAAKSFQMIARYLSLLALSPWKREFYRLKTFGGFYQSHIAYYLRSAESIFMLVGFSDDCGDLVLDRGPVLEDLINVSFECQVAAVECRVISCVWNLLGEDSETISMKTVIKFCLSHAGGAEQVAQKLKQSYQSSFQNRGASLKDAVAYTNVSPTVKLQSANTCSTSDNFTEPFRSRLKEHMKTLSENIPFIDDDGEKEAVDCNQTEGTLDDHLRASLQIVNDDTSKARQSPEQNMGPSEEWAFVREGLEKNFGKKYYQGPRKDIFEERDDRYLDEIENCPYVVPAPKVTRQVLKDSRKVARPSNRLSAPVDTSLTHSAAADSDYFTEGTHIYGPPEIPASGRLSQGSRMSETDILRKKPALIPLKEEGYARQYSTTVPLLRQGGKRATEPRGHFSQSMPPSPYQSSNNVSDGLMNIKSNMKRSSAPTVTKETVIPKPMAFTAQSFSPLHSKYDVKGIESQTEDRWPCFFCTYQNNQYTLVCEMCGKSRDFNPETDSAYVGETMRVCDKCTYDNTIDSDTCVVCHHKLNGSQTVV